jgi:hypothetical protein
MEIADNEPEEQLKIDPATAGEDSSADTWAKRGDSWFEDRLGEMHGSPDDKQDIETVMRQEYGELLRSPDATSVLMAILRELVMMRMHA